MSGSDETGESNTRCKNWTRLHLDYLSVSVRNADPWFVVRWAYGLFAGEGAVREWAKPTAKGSTGYRQGLTNGAGLFVWFDGYGLTKGRTRLEVKGQAIGHMGLDDVQRIGAALHKLGEYSMTRLDVALDVVAPGVGVPTFQRALDAGTFKVKGCRKSKEISCRSGWLPSDGNTVYFGERSSDRFIRVYDKEFDQGEGIRFEVVYSNGLVKLMGGFMATDVEQLLDVVLDDWRGSVDTSEGWWVSAVGEGKAERLSAGRVVNADLERTRDWLEKSCGPALRRCVKEYGYEWLHEAVLRES